MISIKQSISPEYEFLFNDLDEGDLDVSDDENDDEKSKDGAKANKDNQPLEDTFNQSLALNCTMDESIINAPISHKNRLESNGSLSSLVISKKPRF